MGSTLFRLVIYQRPNRVLDLELIIRFHALQTRQSGRQRFVSMHVLVPGDWSVTRGHDLLEAVELGFLLEIAEIMVVSARARNESRGAHFREDHPNRDDVNFMRHTMAYKEPDGQIRLDYKPVVMTRYQPMERKY